jgi:hypothetical protein
MQKVMGRKSPQIVEVLSERLRKKVMAELTGDSVESRNQQKRKVKRKRRGKKADSVNPINPIIDLLN